MHLDETRQPGDQGHGSQGCHRSSCCLRRWIWHCRLNLFRPNFRWKNRSIWRCASFFYKIGLSLFVFEMSINFYPLNKKMFKLNEFLAFLKTLDLFCFFQSSNTSQMWTRGQFYKACTKHSNWCSKHQNPILNFINEFWCFQHQNCCLKY